VRSFSHLCCSSLSNRRYNSGVAAFGAEQVADGQFSERGCALFPTACEVVAQIPQITGSLRRADGSTASVGGQVTVLRLLPGTHLQAHFGLHNRRLTTHLGLIVPAGAAIRVGGPQWQVTGDAAAEAAGKTWTEGGLLTFDDSIVHEVSSLGDLQAVLKQSLLLILAVNRPSGVAQRQRSAVRALRVVLSPAADAGRRAAAARERLEAQAINVALEIIDF